MHTLADRNVLAALLERRLAGTPAPAGTDPVVTYVLDLFVQLVSIPGMVNVAARDLVGMAAGMADLRVIPMPGGLAPVAPRPGRRWAIHTFEANGHSAEYLAGQLEVFCQEYLTPRAAMVFDVQGHENITLHTIAEVANAVYRRTGKDNDVLFGAVGAPRTPWRLGLALVLLIPIP